MSSISERSTILEEEEYEEKTIKKTTPYMSNYEFCALITARALQLSTDRPKINISNYDPTVIATEEIRKKLVSLVVRRTLPDGSTEDWLLKDMVLPKQ